jgi:signal transduction histidine kinase
LKQLLLNVLLNAIEAMPKGGELTIRIARRQSLEGHMLALEIKDTGPGIPDHLLEQIFDPFVTTKPQGSGLGLSICQGIIEAHRGTIVARNNTGGSGATIIIGLPITQSTPAAMSPA